MPTALPETPLLGLGFVKEDFGSASVDSSYLSKLL